MAAQSFDKAKDRPDHIDAILNGLDRYNPDTTRVFEDYVAMQCEEKTFDSYANLALLKLYQFNPHLARDEIITNILVKSITVFPSPDFSLCLHLLPSHILTTLSSASSLPAAGDAPLSEAVSKLAVLNGLLSEANYKSFWSTFHHDDLYTDLVTDVAGFEEIMCIRIAITVQHSCREIERSVLESWLNLKGTDFDKFVAEICGWGLDTSRGPKGGVVVIPTNKENEAKATVARETVHFDQFSRIIRRAYEQPV